MGQRIAGQSARGLTTTVSDIEYIESQSLSGISVIKVFFQPTANIQTAIAQVVASMQTQVRQLPPGITPPLVIKYSVSIPAIQLALSSPTLPEQSVFDSAANVLRPQLITIPGVAVPFPCGGKNRLISVDLDFAALQARGILPADVVNAVNLQNLVLPSGTAKFGLTEYTIKMNGSPNTIAGLGDLPIRTAGNTTTYLRDVAQVRDGFSPQTNIVRQDGARGVLLSVLKNGGASTLDIVSNLRALLPRVTQVLPADISVTPLFDQSVFVKAAVKGVVVEAPIAAALTAAMVLLLLGNWRSSSIASARASAEQAGADFENLRLLQSADLASNYFNLRALDVELDVLNRSIALQNRALELVRASLDLGATTGLDVAQQQALLDTTRVQVDVLRRQRGQFEHAIAALAGIPAPLFTLAPDVRELAPPPVPLGLPSDLLERRPDIASAERAMAAANAQIGVANAAFYPSIILGSALGAESNRLSTLFDAPSLLWSLGLSATEVLFDGGRIKANLGVAKLGHTAQQSWLASERQASQLPGQRLVTSVFLVKALGGDWQPMGQTLSQSGL